MLKTALWVLLGFATAAPSPAQSPLGITSQDSKHGHPAPGTSLVRFAQIDDGVYKGSEPKSDADYRFLQSLGIRYIVELKFFPLLPRFEKHKAERYGMTLIPVTINASPFAPSEKHVNRAICILKDKQFHPLYLHCDIGRDRTSLVATLYEMYFRGLPPKDAWARMKEFGYKDSWTIGGLKNYLQKQARAMELSDASPDCSGIP